MPSQRNTSTFIAGALIGGIVGAAFTLWNTPVSGDELREQLAGPRDASSTSGTPEPAPDTGRQRFSNPVLSFVEKATAPIVGVELGKLAKDDPRTATPIRTSAA